MTRTVTVTILTQSDQVTSVNPFGGLIVNLIGPAGSPAIPPQTLSPGATVGGSYVATFTEVPAGVAPGTTYTATVQDIDTTGAAVGALLTSAPYAVIDLPVTSAFDVPVSITIGAAPAAPAA